MAIVGTKSVAGSEVLAWRLTNWLVAIGPGSKGILWA
jgi:hypothetical protein